MKVINKWPFYDFWDFFFEKSWMPTYFYYKVYIVRRKKKKEKERVPNFRGGIRRSNRIRQVFRGDVFYVAFFGE